MASSSGTFDPSASPSVGVPIDSAGESYSPDRPAGNREAFNVIERDATSINSHLKVTFDDIFAESHPTLHSFDSIWSTSYIVFRNTKMWCYKLVTMVFAVPAAAMWGVSFAMLACCGVWCCRPFLRAFQTSVHWIKGLYSVLVTGFVRPCFEAVGFVFNNFRVTSFLNQSGQVDSKQVRRDGQRTVAEDKVGRLEAEGRDSDPGHLNFSESCVRYTDRFPGGYDVGHASAKQPTASVFF